MYEELSMCQIFIQIRKINFETKSCTYKIFPQKLVFLLFLLFSRFHDFHDFSRFFRCTAFTFLTKEIMSWFIYEEYIIYRARGYCST